MKSCAPEGLAVLAPLVALIMLLLLQSQWYVAASDKPFLVEVLWKEHFPLIWHFFYGIQVANQIPIHMKNYNLEDQSDL
jgi:hypothetical protein